VFNRQPLAIAGEQAVQGVRVGLTRGSGSGRGGNAELVAGSEEILDADVVITAFGFRASPAPWLAEHGVRLQENVRITVAGGLPYQTSNPRIFAGGDNVRGADLVVTAVHDGRDAGVAIARMLLD